jgi:hypothetical protein
VFAKIGTQENDHLQHELKAYNIMHSLQGNVIPQCLGLFHIPGFGDLLLFVDGGSAITDMDQLSLKQRFILTLNIYLD